MLIQIRLREAEAAGWKFPHYEKGDFRAEKSYNGKLVNEWGESLDLLLTRIEAWEGDHAESAVDVGPAEAPADHETVTEADQAAPTADDGGEDRWEDEGGASHSE